MGPFEQAPYTCKYAISLVDYFSKCPEIRFCPTVIDFLHAIFAREGYPDRVVSDNGSQFTSSKLEQFLKTRGIAHSYSSVYYPQANGLVKRFNCVLKSYIQLAMLGKRPIRQAITEYLGIYRCTVHATTGISPAELLHGRKPRTCLDIVGFPPPNFDKDPATTMQELHQRVAAKQEKSRQYTDNRRAARTANFQEGQYVRVRKPGSTAKGMPAFTKPQKILKKKWKYSFKLADGKTWNGSKFT